MELEHQINTDPNTGGIVVAHRLKKFFGCCHGRTAGVQKIYFCQDFAIAVESDPTANRLVTELLNHEQLIAPA